MTYIMDHNKLTRYKGHDSFSHWKCHCTAELLPLRGEKIV